MTTMQKIAEIESEVRSSLLASLVPSPAVLYGHAQCSGRTLDAIMCG